MNKILLSCALVLALCFTACSDKDSSRSDFVEAEKCFSRKDFDGALLYARNSYKKDSSFINAKILEGKIYFFEGNFDESYKLFKKMHKKVERSQDALLYLIRTCLELDKLDEAENLIKDGLKFNSTDWQLYYLYSVLEGRRGNQDKRLAFCRKCRTLLTASEKLYVELAEIYLSLGLKSNAVSYLEQAKLVSMEPGLIDSLIEQIKTGGEL
jgi:tetratricopeptide (TPR) repeat protein